MDLEKYILLHYQFFMTSELDAEKHKILQRIAEEFTLNLNLDVSVDIKLN